MNEKGVAVLVDAGMKGVRQIKGELADGQGGFCAGGVLIEALRRERAWFRSVPLAIWNVTRKDFERAQRAYGMSEAEWSRMVELNNDEGLDFIAIARKLGPDS